MQRAVNPAPLGGERVAHRDDVLGHRDVELEYVSGLRQLAGHPLGERQSPADTGEHDLCPLLLRQLRDAERERGFGEDAGDEDVLSVEKTHSANPIFRAVVVGTSAAGER
ncbi:unannotated protein [freshwater metagenome]|uniref:Unannotated protein n=1 Tax=freshwater metagenome TaxID=449393 RepID=A0A6J7Q0T3_9ZZZZ